jgi:hypothetical protein
MCSFWHNSLEIYLQNDNSDSYQIIIYGSCHIFCVQTRTYYTGFYNDDTCIQHYTGTLYWVNTKLTFREIFS